MGNCSLTRVLVALLLGVTACVAWAQGAPKTATATKAGSSTPELFGREKASDACTTAPKSEWLPEEEMKLLAEHRGYRIKTFKLAKGNCYEVYGFDKEGRIVEAYFNPVTSKLIRQNIAK